MTRRRSERPEATPYRRWRPRPEPLDPLRVRVAPSEHGCRRGWLDDDEQGRPRPCLVCRPHLAGERHRGQDQPTTAPTEHHPTPTRRNR